MRACLAGCAFSPRTIAALEATGVRRVGAGERGGGAFVTPTGGKGVVYGGDASHAKVRSLLAWVVEGFSKVFVRPRRICTPMRFAWIHHPANICTRSRLPLPHWCP